MRGIKPRLVVDNAAVKTAPVAPSWLSRDAKEEWRRVTPILTERGILTDGDRGALESYCVAVGGVRETARIITRQGRIIKSPAGPKPHPGVRMQLQYLETARRYAAELGLTPVARQRAQGGKGAEGADDDWD